VRDHAGRGHLEWADDATHAWFLESFGPPPEGSANPGPAVFSGLNPEPALSPHSITWHTTNVVGERYLAFFLDLLLIWAVQYVVALGVYSVVGPQSGLDDVVGLLALAMFFCYFGLSEHYYGSTLGKRVTGLRVVTESGLPVSIGQALGRNLALVIDLLLWTLPALISMSSSPLHQRLGDRWAHTVVIHTPKPRAVAPTPNSAGGQPVTAEYPSAAPSLDRTPSQACAAQPVVPSHIRALYRAAREKYAEWMSADEAIHGFPDEDRNDVQRSEFLSAFACVVEACRTADPGVRRVVCEWAPAEFARANEDPVFTAALEVLRP
jgi:uncharacterized RDD family membrane protein YckC